MGNRAKNFLITLKNLRQMHLELLQKESFKKQKKTAEVISDLTGNKITDRNMKVSKHWQQNNSEISRRKTWNYSWTEIKIVYKWNIKKVTQFSKKVQQNKAETVANQSDKEIPKERHICREERQKIIDNLKFNIIVKTF